MGLSSGNSKSRSSRRPVHLLSEINVTPMVDVLLVVLLVFMVAGQMVVAGTEVDLPDADAKPVASQPEAIQISIDAEQNIYLGETAVSPDTFADAIKQLAQGTAAPTETKVFVRGDQSVPYGRVMEIVSQVADAGFTKVAFVSDPSLRPAQAGSP